MKPPPTLYMAAVNLAPPIADLSCPNAFSTLAPSEQSVLIPIALPPAASISLTSGS